MTQLANELGRVVRTALGSWAQTIRLVVLLLPVVALLYFLYR